MQNNFECIFKLIVALSFLMCVVCSLYQYFFLMFYIILLFSFYVFFLLLFLFFLNERQKNEVKRKRQSK